MPRRLSALALLLLAGTAEAEECPAPAGLDDGWRVSAPTTQGLDPTLVCPIGAHFEAWSEANLHAVVVARHGSLVYEHYLAGDDERWGRPLGRVSYDVGKLHDLRSITKGVTSLLVGIALDHGWIKDIDAPIFSFFPEYAKLRTPEKDTITLRHLLTMSAGFAWDETRIPYSDLANSDRRMTAAADPYRYLLEQPLTASPGEFYNYNSGETALLGAVLHKTSGKAIDALAQEELFGPLGISETEWARYANGEPIAGWGLRMRQRDTAKIGQLVLDHGKWQGRPIVQAAWITRSTAPWINGQGLFFYGYQWWLGRSLVERREINWIAGVGLGGQRLYIVPDRDLVVAVSAGLYSSQFQDEVGSTVLNRYVLPAGAH